MGTAARKVELVEIEANLTIEMDGSEATVCGSGKDLDVRFKSVKSLVRSVRTTSGFRHREALLKRVRDEGICFRLFVGEQLLVEVGDRRERSGWCLGGKQWRVWPLRWAIAARASQRN